MSEGLDCRTIADSAERHHSSVGNTVTAHVCKLARGHNIRTPSVALRYYACAVVRVAEGINPRDKLTIMQQHSSTLIETTTYVYDLLDCCCS